MARFGFLAPLASSLVRSLPKKALSEPDVSHEFANFLGLSKKSVFGTQGREPSRSIERGRFSPKGFRLSPVWLKTIVFPSFREVLEKSSVLELRAENHLGR